MYKIPPESRSLENEVIELTLTNPASITAILTPLPVNSCSCKKSKFSISIWFLVDPYSIDFSNDINFLYFCGLVFKFLFGFKDLLANSTLATKLKSVKLVNKSISASTYTQLSHFDFDNMDKLSKSLIICI